MDSSTRDCPVCQRPGLAANAQHCPQCGADLECFTLLDNLQEPGEGNGIGVPFSPKAKRFVLISLSVVLIGVLLTGAYLGVRIEQLMDRLELRMQQLTSQLVVIAPSLKYPEMSERSTRRANAMNQRVKDSPKHSGLSVSRSTRDWDSPVSGRGSQKDTKTIAARKEEPRFVSQEDKANNSVLRTEDWEFEQQIADFDRRRALVKKRLDAALATYNASSFVVSPTEP